MARKNTFSKKIQYLDACEEDEDGFSEGEVKTDKVFASFSFATQPAEQTAAGVQAVPFSIIPAAAPPVDGEAHTVNRFYKIRYSTAKMLNEIKASHPDVNVYMNSIVDEAIRHYYSFVFKKE
jgi:hypothetical protein